MSRSKKPKAPRSAAEPGVNPTCHLSGRSQAEAVTRDVLELGRRDATLRVTLSAKKPSILDEVAASTASKRWAFTAEQLVDIAEVRAAVRAGQIPRVGVERLARILKLRYDMRWSVASIMDRIKETP